MVELKKKLNNLISIDNKGIGLVEALLAVALGAILIVSLLTLNSFNIRNSLLVTENQKAISSTNLMLENLRAQKDTDFTAFYNKVNANCVSSSCIIDPVSGITKASSIDKNPASPTSYFTVTINSPTEIKVDIMTYWVVGSSNFSSPLSTLFTNWRAK